MRNQTWEQEEEILLVDLYYELKQISASKEEIAQKINELSELLRKRASILGYDVSDTYRNSTDLTMKLGNIQFIDTDGEMGLSAASNADIEMVSAYKANPQLIHSQALMIYEKYDRTIAIHDNEISLSIEECPLVAELKKLKKSSLEAVDDNESFSNFKRYMHIQKKNWQKF